MRRNEINLFFLDIKSVIKNLAWYLPKLIFQTRHAGAEHVNIWKSFLNKYSNIRVPNSPRFDLIIFKI